MDLMDAARMIEIAYLTVLADLEAEIAQSRDPAHLLIALRVVRERMAARGLVPPDQLGPVKIAP